MFVESLAATPIKSLSIIEEALLADERVQLERLKHVHSRAAADASERLTRIWDKMGRISIAGEYVVLRRSHPLNWVETRHLLRKASFAPDDPQGRAAPR